MNQYERDIIQHIERYGCSVTSVFDPGEATPPFSYSIGIARSSSAPELIVVGLGAKLALALINEYNGRVRSGERFDIGVLYTGFLEGFAVQFGPVTRDHRVRYMKSTCWLHGGPGFEALQLIWPSTTGEWPWDATASDWLRGHQPLLSREVA